MSIALSAPHALINARSWRSVRQSYRSAPSTSADWLEMLGPKEGPGARYSDNTRLSAVSSVSAV
jgi:hypothetical protein